MTKGNSLREEKPELSKCCQKPIKSVGSSDFGGDIGTYHWVCSGCQKACNLYVDPESKASDSDTFPRRMDLNGRLMMKCPDCLKEHTKPWNWEAEFKALPRYYGKVICSQDNPMMQQRDLRVFIRKVAQHSREEGEKEMLKDCIALLKEDVEGLRREADPSHTYIAGVSSAIGIIQTLNHGTL